MSIQQAIELHAQPRDRTGTGATRALRREGRLPAIIYGGKGQATPITLTAHAVTMASRSRSFMTSMVAIKMGNETIQVLVRDLQRDVVTGTPIHADLLRVTAATELVVEVPVVFLNADICPGIKVGGVLNVVRRDLEVRCQVSRIPEQIEIDLAEVIAGQSIHISAVSLPEGVAPTITDRDFTIATIAAPSGISEDTADEDAEQEDTQDESEGGQETED
ncbi:MAG: 50S ribosomal protein L25/general stress protein Ctc [Pseudomonadota bacterium]